MQNFFVASPESGVLTYIGISGYFDEAKLKNWEIPNVQLRELNPEQALPKSWHCQNLLMHL